MSPVSLAEDQESPVKLVNPANPTHLLKMMAKWLFDNK